jgi:hypothetical protein
MFVTWLEFTHLNFITQQFESSISAQPHAVRPMEDQSCRLIRPIRLSILRLLFFISHFKSEVQTKVAKFNVQSSETVKLRSYTTVYILHSTFTITADSIA